MDLTAAQRTALQTIARYWPRPRSGANLQPGALAALKRKGLIEVVTYSPTGAPQWLVTTAGRDWLEADDTDWTEGMPERGGYGPV
jgi:hypothetical protein